MLHSQYKVAYLFLEWGELRYLLSNVEGDGLKDKLRVFINNSEYLAGEPVHCGFDEEELSRILYYLPKGEDNERIRDLCQRAGVNIFKW